MNLKVNHIIALIIITSIVMMGVIFYVIIAPTYSSEVIEKMAYDHCKEYEGVKHVQENLIKVLILCNKVSGKRLWWDTYESKSIPRDGEILKHSLESKIIFFIWLLIILGILFEIANKKEKKK